MIITQQALLQYAEKYGYSRAKIESTCPWMSFAINELGVSESPGDLDNPRILEFHKATAYGAKDDEVAWCSAFVNWCMKQSGYQRTGSAAARSWLNYGQMLPEPKTGCIAVLWRGDPNSWQGHVGFYLREPQGCNDNIYLLGGNQGDAVSVVAYPKSRVLAYRWPVAE